LIIGKMKPGMPNLGLDRVSFKNSYRNG